MNMYIILNHLLSYILPPYKLFSQISSIILLYLYIFHTEYLFTLVNRLFNLRILI